MGKSDLLLLPMWLPQHHRGAEVPSLSLGSGENTELPQDSPDTTLVVRLLEETPCYLSTAESRRPGPSHDLHWLWWRISLPLRDNLAFTDTASARQYLCWGWDALSGWLGQKLPHSASAHRDEATDLAGVEQLLSRSFLLTRLPLFCSFG